MSEAEEPSYYEIALTNRQVLVAFTILLVCMLASFFAGLWIGRGDAQASASPPPMEVAEADPAAADDLQEFKFFSEEGSEEGGGSDEAPQEDATSDAARPDAVREVPVTPPPPASPPTPTTLAEDVLDEEPAEEAAPPPPPPPPAPAPPPPRTVPESSGAEDNPAVPRSTVRRPPTTAEQVFIQVFSSRDEGQAGKVLQRLKGGGFPAFLSPVEVNGQTMHRVRLGPYDDRSEAETVAGRVRQQLRLETWITP
ncbi:MAG: SPOR domain-containing protein [Acidobacteriota bacterium]|nr:SPOR domain-containing protein [Acidobacteriota bacterium]